jgi:hypothetical protein
VIGGRRCTASSFTLSTITSRVLANAPAERADTLLLFLLYVVLLFRLVNLNGGMYSIFLENRKTSL